MCRLQEGKQASLAADFSITQFKHLGRLLMVHGRNSYKRSAALSQFVIHRSLCISTMQVRGGWHLPESLLICVHRHTTQVGSSCCLFTWAWHPGRQAAGIFHRCRQAHRAGGLQLAVLTDRHMEAWRAGGLQLVLLHSCTQVHCPGEQPARTFLCIHMGTLPRLGEQLAPLHWYTWAYCPGGWQLVSCPGARDSHYHRKPSSWTVLWSCDPT